MAVVFSMLILAVGNRSSANEESKWSVATSIAVRYFVTNQFDAGDWEWTPGDPTVPAPGGAKFFFITHRGDIVCDCNIYEMHVFLTRQVSAALNRRVNGSRGQKVVPFRVLTVQSGTNDPGIAGARWVDGGESVLFVGSQDKGNRAIYKYNVLADSLEILTDPSRDATFQFDYQAGALVYLADESVSPLPTIDDKYPAATVRPDDMGVALLAHAPYLHSQAVFVSTGSAKRKKILSIWPDPSLSGNVPKFLGPWVSPDGKSAVIAASALEWPRDRSWAFDSGAKAARATDSAQPYPLRFFMVDLVHFSARPLVDAPTGLETPMGRSPEALTPKAAWSADSRYVVVVNTALPQPDGVEDHAYIAVFSALGGSHQRLDPVIEAETQSKIHDVKWKGNEREFRIWRESSNGESVPGSMYKLRGTQWVRSVAPKDEAVPHGDALKLSNNITITLRESSNEPPAIIALRGKSAVNLTDDDPALQGVWRSRVKTVHWTEEGRKELVGGLMLPRDFDPSNPPPLVIQPYLYLPDVFRPDGITPSSFAAQGFVAAGMAVLQFSDPGDENGIPISSEIKETPLEAPSFVKRIDAAVEMLARQGLVDAKRVGLIGWSRSGWLTYYAITHPGRTEISAAIDSDGWTGSFGGYVIRGSLPSYATSALASMAKSVGGGPFWEHKAAWLKGANSFNIDQVRTPLLLTSAGRPGLVEMAETVGAFRLNHRPLEYLYIPQGTHVLVRPLERQASLQASIDWMSFWLKGEIPSDSEEAGRWLELRKQQQVVLDEQPAAGRKVTPLPPLVHPLGITSEAP